jgi:hypothetical protein
MRENCTSSLCGGRMSAREQSSAPPPTRHSEVGRAGHMGKRSAVVELFLGDMGSIQWETQPVASQREDLLTMATKLEQIATNLPRPKRRPLTGDRKCSRCCESTAEERSAVTPHATFCGSRRRVTASDDPVGGETGRVSTRNRALPRLYL